MVFFSSVRKVVTCTVMVAVSAAAGIHAFSYWARQAAESELLLAKIRAEIHALNTLEWQAISKGRVDITLQQKVAESRRRIDIFRHAVTGPDDCMDEFNDIYRDYTIALDREYGLIKSKKLAEAHALDESVVDPLFEKLNDELNEIATELAATKEHISLVADAGMAFSLLGSALIVASMFAAFTRSRTRQGKKLAEARELTELASDATWEQDENFCFTHVSAGGDGLGLPSLIIGATRWQLPVDPDAADWSAHRATLEAHLPFKNFEYKLQESGMPVQWISSSGNPQFDVNGNFTGYRGTSRNITARKQAEETLRRSRSKLRQLVNYQERDKEDERKRIARDIHDELGQSLMVLRLDLVRMNRNLAQEAHIKEPIETALSQIDATIKSVRSIMNDLRPAVLDLGLHAAIEWQAQEFERHSGIGCEVHIDHAEFPLDDQCATALFRSTQELLMNIIRHAQASQVWLDMLLTDGQLTLQIADDGIGGDPNCRRKENALGLIGIEERMHALGGTFSTASEPGQGMSIKLSIPVGA